MKYDEPEPEPDLVDLDSFKAFVCGLNLSAAFCPSIDEIKNLMSRGQLEYDPKTSPLDHRAIHYHLYATECEHCLRIVGKAPRVVREFPGASATTLAKATNSAPATPQWAPSWNYSSLFASYDADLEGWLDKRCSDFIDKINHGIAKGEIRYPKAYFNSVIRLRINDWAQEPGAKQTSFDETIHHTPKPNATLPPLEIREKREQQLKGGGEFLKHILGLHNKWSHRLLVEWYFCDRAPSIAAAWDSGINPAKMEADNRLLMWNPNYKNRDSVHSVVNKLLTAIKVEFDRVLIQWSRHASRLRELRTD